VSAEENIGSENEKRYEKYGSNSPISITDPVHCGVKESITRINEIDEETPFEKANEPIPNRQMKQGRLEFSEDSQQILRV